MQAGHVPPGATGTITLLRVAVIARAFTTADLLIRREQRRGQLGALWNGGLGDDGQELFRAHNTAHPTTPGKARFALTRLDFIARAAGNSGIGVLLPMLSRWSQGSHVRARMPIGQRHNLLMRSLAQQIRGVFKRQAQRVTVFMDEEVDRTLGAS